MKSLTLIKSLFFIIFTSFLITACGSGGNESSNDTPLDSDKNTNFSSTAVFSSNLESSPMCPHGGIEIHTGIDSNQNGLLDEDEINNSQELCHADTDQILTSVDAIELESECFYGGNRLKIGYDDNKNGSLEGSEVIQTNFFCAQKPSLSLALLAYNNEFIGPGEICSAGGRKLSSGIDLNKNRTLDADEVSDIEYLCDHDGPIRPYQYSFECDYSPCDLINVESTKIIIPEVNESISITRVFDDGFGHIALLADPSLPSWLTVELSEFKTDHYYNNGYYDIIATATNIPTEAYDHAFNSKINVTDGQNTFDIEFSVKVIKPIKISLDKTQLETIELGDNKNNVHFIKVNFDSPLPATLYENSSNSYNAASNYMLNVFFEEGDQELQRSNSNEDFSVEWVGGSLFRGQTEGTIMLTIKDDYLPEITETYKIAVGSSYYNEAKGIAFKQEYIHLQISDDGDLPITAALTLDAESVNEATTPEEDKEELGFTVSFDQPLPSDASMQLRIQPTENSYSTGGKDAGFNDRCSTINYNNYYCDSYMIIPLYKGMTEYKGSIKIKPDALKEGNEEFKLSIEQNSISFIMADLEDTFTIIDDDEIPAINFVDKKIETYYKSSVINVPLHLSNPSIEDVELTFYVDDEDSLIEGIHFDFAVSMPMVFSGRADELYLPIIFYENEFEEDKLNTIIHVEAVSGAIDGISTSVELVLDKIAPFYMNASSLRVPVTDGAHLNDNHLVLSEDGYIYKLGEISDGNIIGQEVVGDRDLFAAKFDLQGSMIWARQFGTVSWDHISSSSISSVKNDNGILVNTYTDYYISASGEITTLADLIDGYSLNISDLNKDSEGNFFLLARKSYHSSDGDLDGDGSTTDFILAKYDVEWNQLWFTEDFTDIEPAHTNFDFNAAHLRLTKSGIPYLLGYTGEYRINNTFSSLSALGRDDLMLASFNTTNGTTRTFKNFGSNQSDSAYYSYLQAMGEDQLIGFYKVSSGAIIDGEITDESISIKFIVDNEGNISQSVYKPNGASRIVESLEKSTNGYLFMVDVPHSSSSERTLSILDEAFKLVSKTTETDFYSSNLRSYFDRTPVYLDEGAYLVTNNEHITKLTSTIKIRQPD